MHKHHFSPWANIALYLACLLAVGAVCFALQQPRHSEPAGDLTERFQSEITCQVGDTTYHYRESVLTNLLLMGIDRTESTRPETTAQEGGQADFLLLLTADRETRTLMLTHIDRDTITEMTTYGIFGDPAGSITTQICLSHAFGTTEEQRCGNTVAAVSALFGGIPIDGYVAMDMEDIATLNDALGGVTVTLEEDFSREDPSMTPGTTMTLTGNQAEIFVRYRATVADGTNTNRMKRQRTYMTAVLEMLETDDDPSAQDLLETMEAEIYTDLTQQELLADFDRWHQYHRETIQTMEGRHTVDEDGFVAFYPEKQWLETYLLQHFYE